jgi:hypothetical protein
MEFDLQELRLKVNPFPGIYDIKLSGAANENDRINPRNRING